MSGVRGINFIVLNFVQEIPMPCTSLNVPGSVIFSTPAMASSISRTSSSQGLSGASDLEKPDLKMKVQQFKIRLRLQGGNAYQFLNVRKTVTGLRSCLSLSGHYE